MSFSPDVRRLMENHIFNQMFRKVLHKTIECQVSPLAAACPFGFHPAEANRIDFHGQDFRGDFHKTVNAMAQVLQLQPKDSKSF